MFAGIVEEAARVARVETQQGLVRLSVESGLDHSGTAIGDSIAIEGVCLTVVERRDRTLLFEVSAETLRRSTLGALRAGQRVNLERSLKVGDRVHGHFVFGHVDATTELLSRTPDGECERYEWRIPDGLGDCIAEKGSISVAGVSLTVGEVSRESFSVYIIPHTAAVTTLAKRSPGAAANVEIDMLARYVRAALGARSSAGSGGVTLDLLKRHGYLPPEAT